MEPLAQLDLVDSIRKLGLASFFEEAISHTLRNIMSEKNSPCIKSNLYANALCFRLLRQQGYGVSQGTDPHDSLSIIVGFQSLKQILQKDILQHK